MANCIEDLLRNNDEIGAYSKIGLPLVIRASRHGVENLSAIEQKFLGVYQSHTEVNNGGFYGYFTNAAADFVQDALRGLSAIGAIKTKAI